MICLSNFPEALGQLLVHRPLESNMAHQRRKTLAKDGAAPTRTRRG
jgi:hypothetical protein